MASKRCCQQLHNSLHKLHAALLQPHVIRTTSQITFKRSYLTTTTVTQGGGVLNKGGLLRPPYIITSALISKTTTIPSRSFQTSHLTAAKNFYKTLGVDKGVSSGDIKKAYYQLAKEYHPDTNKEPGAAERFQEIQEAYEVLSDADKRASYDQFGDPNATAGGGFGGGGGGFQQNINMDDIFKQFFGEGGPQNQRGGGFQQQMRNFTMNISFMQAVNGGAVDTYVELPTTCKRCNGTAWEPSSAKRKCGKCHGSGEQVNRMFNMRTACQACMGSGEVSDACRSCKGQGSVMERQRLTVDIPAGIDKGQTLRVPVKGGEVYVTFNISESETFTREGSDVHSEVWISFIQAMLGGHVKVKGLYEDITLPITNGTQPDQVKCLVGKGVSHLNAPGRGDHYVRFKVQIPKYLNLRQKELMETFAEEVDDVTVNGTVRVRGKEK